MINKRKVLAIIPARAGSKGVKGKNIKKINGKPLIEYTIKEAISSKYIDRVIVSTDSQEIKNVSEKAGAEVPFLRPNFLANDDSTTLDVLKHAVESLESTYDLIVTLQPTSPLRKVMHIDEALECLGNKDSLISVKESDYHPFWMKKIEDNKVTNFIESTDVYTRRQDLPKVYQLNGAIFISKVDLIMKENRIYSEDVVPYIMDAHNSFDIDTELDFEICEYLLSKK